MSKLQDFQNAELNNAKNVEGQTWGLSWLFGSRRYSGYGRRYSGHGHGYGGGCNSGCNSGCYSGGYWRP